MIRVRFSTGITVQYNSANHLKYNASAWELYESDGGKWVASIQLSAGAIVEVYPACRVYQGCGDSEGDKLSSVLGDVSKIKAKITKLSTGERKRRKAR